MSDSFSMQKISARRRSYPATDTIKTNRADCHRVIVVQRSVAAAFLRLKAFVTMNCAQTESRTNVDELLGICYSEVVKFKSTNHSLFICIK